MKHLFFREYRDLEGQGGYERENVHAVAANNKPTILAGQKELAKKAEVQLSYAIGVAKPISILVETFGTGVISQDNLKEIIKDNFDLRPAAIIKEFDLRNLPKKMGGEFFRKTASYGHFGRNDLKLPWESVEKKSVQLIEASKDFL